MPFKQTIEIDVDDSRFKEFHKNFEKYQAAVGKLPKAWASQEKGAKGIKSHIADMTAAILAQHEMLAKTVLEQGKLDRATQSSGRSMGVLARTVERVAGGLRSATASLLRWGTITGVAGGLLGAGSLFGVANLAGSAYAMRRSAGGLGTTVGQERAFGLNYGQFVDSGSLLGNIASAKSDLASRWAFSAAGVNQQGKDPATIATELVQRAKALYGQNQSQQFAQAHGLLQFFSMDDLRRIGGASNGALAGARAGYGRDVGALGLSEQTQQAWNKLDIQLRRAGNTIETSFLNALVRAAPAIDKLSSSFTQLVDKFLTGDKLQNWISNIDKGLETFADYIGSARFQNSVKDFVDGVAGISSVLKAFGWVTKGAGLVGDLAAGAYEGGVKPLGQALVGAIPNKRSPLNLKEYYGAHTFRTFADLSSGAQADYAQLLRNQDRHGINTVEGQIRRWTSGDPEDVVRNYIRKVTSETGWGANQKIDMHQAGVAQALMNAMTHAEGHKDIVITVINNTGGAAVVNASQLPQ